MAKTEELFTARKSLDEICKVPDKIISVYALEQHVWAESNSVEARQLRQPELQTIREFQIDPVRSFLSDVLRQMAAPYRADRRDQPVGQGWWIQAEFGSGKSHLLCFLSALALGDQEAWDLVREKEQKAGRGKRDSLYHFWEDGLEAKSKGGKGTFVIVTTLVGRGGGVVGVNQSGGRLSEYILEAAKEQIQLELGQNLSLYPTEILSDRFMAEDLDRYRKDLGKFLRDPRFFTEDQFEDVNDFIRDIQQNKSPEYKRSAGNKLWRFYTEYLKVQPHVEAETEDILQHMVETIMAEGYSGVLLVLDEVSLFMKSRSDEERVDDEKTLVVLSNRLAKVHNLPIWTVCAAQQAIESKMGVKNIIADDRLKLVKLLESDQDYYGIVLARVREIVDPAAIRNYYLYYRRGFSWPASIGEQEFAQFFPFHKPAIEVLRAVTYELTTTRSAIHFMHQTLKYQVKQKGNELIRLWELFDEAVRYEEDPSGVHAGLVAIKTRRETEYRAYEACRRQIDAQTRGPLKVLRDKAIKVMQTLFLYHIARIRQQGLTAEEIANSVMIPRDADSDAAENNDHYQTLADKLKSELRQVVQSFDEENHSRYRFDPVFTGVNPTDEFRKARDEAEGNESGQEEAWMALLALDQWQVRTRQMTLDLTNGVQSIFREIAQSVNQRAMWWGDDKSLELTWQGRQVFGKQGMRDLRRMVADGLPLPAIDTDQTDEDFAVFISTYPISNESVSKLLAQRKDKRVIVWVPAELTPEERSRLIDFAAYRRLVDQWGGKETEDAVAVVNWVANTLQTDMAKLYKIVDTSYARGRMEALDNARMDFYVAGGLTSILTPVVDRVLSSAYASSSIRFEQFVFRREEAVKVINGIVKTGHIPKGAKPNQNISAVQNFGFGLGIVKRSAERDLDVNENTFVQELWTFIDTKQSDSGQPMKVETIYKNFMGVGGPKDYGLSRRMVQIYLLCLVRLSRVRLGVGPRSGLPFNQIDYSNIAEIDFSTKVLDALTDVLKLEKPENWEVLRPYAEKLLGREIPTTHEDAQITEYRKQLRELFQTEKEGAGRLVERARSLFETLGCANPYEEELKQIAQLFRVDVTGANDINLILNGLKQALGYAAFDTEMTSQKDVDDLASRLKNYRDLQRFVAFEAELRVAAAYVQLGLPERQDLRVARKLQQVVAENLATPQPFIDSEVKLKTELVGRIPAEAGETGTVGALIREYTLVYLALHERVVERVESRRKAIEELITGPKFQALRVLEGIPALQPTIAADLERELRELAAALFDAPNASPDAIRRQLLNGPAYESRLTFHNADETIEQAESAVANAERLVQEALDRKLVVFINPAVRERLQQGEAEPVIAGLLKRDTVDDLRAYVVPVCQSEAGFVDIVSRYLKRIVVRRVRLADFKPTLTTVEKQQVAIVAEEFEAFLSRQLDELDNDDDSLPMLQLE